MVQWLTHRGSLTARLVAHSTQFRVQRLQQRVAMCVPDEFLEIGLPRRQRVHERDVILRCDGNAVVYAHTAVPMSATATQWPLFASLGERSLGSTLFSDPLVERGQLQYARLHPAHALYQRALAAVECQELPASLLARRSVFRRKGGCLLVTEVFLPAVEKL
jgi:chorismate lyase